VKDGSDACEWLEAYGMADDEPAAETLATARIAAAENSGRRRV
jgi:hypothetical protein